MLTPDNRSTTSGLSLGRCATNGLPRAVVVLFVAFALFALLMAAVGIYGVVVGISAVDPTTFATVAAVVATVGLAANYLPAHGSIR